MSLRLWTAILAGAQVIVAGTVLTDVIGPTWAGLLGLTVAGATAGTAVFMRGAAMAPVPDDLARRAYNAYGDEAGWRNHQGHPMPDWDDLPKHTRQNWDAAAAAARRT